MRTWRNHFTPLFSGNNPDEILKNYLRESGFEIVEFIDDKNEFYEFRAPKEMASK